jgi:hypothetical protein
MADSDSVIERTRVSVKVVTRESILAYVPQLMLAHASEHELAQLPSNFLAHVPENVFAHLPPDFVDTLREDPAERVMVEGFEMEPQCHLNWCWAAVAQAVADYYEPNKDWTQKAVAKLMMPEYTYEAECYYLGDVKNESKLPYNTQQLLKAALRKVECFHHSHNPPYKPAPLLAVQQWIDGDSNDPKRRRPVCVRIEWRESGGGHFVVIDGYSRGTTSLHVSDPWGPRSLDIDHDKLAHHYKTFDSDIEGDWTDTMYTKHPTTPEP